MVIAVVAMAVSLGVPALPGTTSAAVASQPCLTQYLPCSSPTSAPNYVFPGMVLPVRSGEHIPDGEYTIQVDPDDVRCFGLLSEVAGVAMVSDGTLSVPATFEVSSSLGEACAGLILQAEGVNPSD